MADINPYDPSANTPGRRGHDHTYGVSIRADAYRGAKLGFRYIAIVSAGFALIASVLFIALPLLHTLTTGGTAPTLLQVVLPIALCIAAVVGLSIAGGALGALIASTVGTICWLRGASVDGASRA